MLLYYDDIIYAGYPSDGIVQVEEEEEEEVNDDSDDRDTYTIEEEYQPRARQPLQSPIVQDNGRRRIRRKVSKGAPIPRYTVLWCE